ncbi:hypothetical protein IW262DRAFT_1548756 [Armillaria fumosa]|nr:hypothetical protein IW262DRAFT_1548756 [Armillaria fumosa]
MDSKERIDAACSFLLQSPPGEINDVLNNVWNIISNDDSLQEGILPALHEYNLTQFIAVDVPGTDHQRGCVGRRHLTLSRSPLPNQLRVRPSHPASDPQPANPIQYLSAHFPNGVSSVFSSASSPNQFVIQVVANKYNPTNYWSGRWHSKYIVDLNEPKVDGKQYARGSAWGFASMTTDGILVTSRMHKTMKKSLKDEEENCTTNMLGNVLRSLKVDEDMQQQELSLKIMASCPELVAGYWSATSLTLEPG